MKKTILALLLTFCTTQLMNAQSELQKITLGAGCFWCIEAVFQELEGVTHVESGYSNGHIKNPAYKEVCSGRTGHAEVAQITYDPSVVNMETILSVFFLVHDPTTLNRQGADVGTQYRSGIYCHDENQFAIAEGVVAQLNENKVYPSPVVTEVKMVDNYYKAEDVHQNYYLNNQNQGYCRMVIQPKLEKFRKVFKEQSR